MIRIRIRLKSTSSFFCILLKRYLNGRKWICFNEFFVDNFYLSSRGGYFILAVRKFVSSLLTFSAYPSTESTPIYPSLQSEPYQVQQIWKGNWNISGIIQGGVFLPKVIVVGSKQRCDEFKIWFDCFCFCERFLPDREKSPYLAEIFSQFFIYQ